MIKRTINNISLGIFVMAGLLFLILLLYMIGKNQNMFESTFILRARFENVQGLVKGNNVRFAGIEVGTVKNIDLVNDTTIEVVMLLKTKMKKYIRKNAVAVIGTDGLMGNKLINITTSKGAAALVRDGDMLIVHKTMDADEMLRILSQTNYDVSLIAANLKSTVQRINSSTALWGILNEKSLPGNLKTALENIRVTSEKANNMVTDLHDMVSDVKEGKGSLGAILKDTAFIVNLNEAVVKIKSVGASTDSLSNEITAIAASIKQEINNGKGPLNALLKDSEMVNKLNSSLENIQKGTSSFNENMEALKSSFLFRNYFKKLEKKKASAPVPTSYR